MSQWFGVSHLVFSPTAVLSVPLLSGKLELHQPPPPMANHLPLFIADSLSPTPPPQLSPFISLAISISGLDSMPSNSSLFFLPIVSFSRARRRIYHRSQVLSEGLKKCPKDSVERLKPLEISNKTLQLCITFCKNMEKIYRGKEKCM